MFFFVNVNDDFYTHFVLKHTLYTSRIKDCSETETVTVDT